MASPSRSGSVARNTVSALAAAALSSLIALFAKHHIFTEAEVKSRVEILLENYSTTISIEAATALDMFHKDILPGDLRLAPGQDRPGGDADL